MTDLETNVLCFCFGVPCCVRVFYSLLLGIVDTCKYSNSQIFHTKGFCVKAVQGPCYGDSKLYMYVYHIAILHSRVSHLASGDIE